jgi:hypothetical protein
VKTNSGGSGTWYPLMQSGASTGYKTPVYNSTFTYDGNTKVLAATASFATLALNVAGGIGVTSVATAG